MLQHIFQHNFLPEYTPQLQNPQPVLKEMSKNDVSFRHSVTHNVQRISAKFSRKSCQFWSECASWVSDFVPSLIRYVLLPFSLGPISDFPNPPNRPRFSTFRPCCSLRKRHPSRKRPAFQRPLRAEVLR